MLDYPKFQEFTSLVVTSKDDNTIIDYCVKNGWLKKILYMQNYILDVNRILADMMYGIKNSLFNEFIYQYVELEEDEIVETLQYLISEMQTVQTNMYYKVVIPLKKEKKQTKKKEVLEHNKEQTFAETHVDKVLDTLTEDFDNFQDEKRQKTVVYYLLQLDKFRSGQITKEELLEKLVLKNGLYYRYEIPVFQQCQVEEGQCQAFEIQDIDEEGHELTIETQVYVQKVVFDYMKLLEGRISNQDQIRLIKDIQKLSDDNIKEYIAIHNYGGMDYIIRLTTLALYKNRPQKYNMDFDYEAYQNMLQITDRETLQFRQENAVNANVNFDEIVNQWWIQLDQQGKFEEEDVEEEEDQFDLDMEDFNAKQTKTMYDLGD